MPNGQSLECTVLLVHKRPLIRRRNAVRFRGWVNTESLHVSGQVGNEGRKDGLIKSGVGGGIGDSLDSWLLITPADGTGEGGFLHLKF